MMTDKKNNTSSWKIEKRSKTMSQRYEFSDYDEMRSFLDQLEELSEKDSFYPDLIFSRTHVSVTIQANDDELTEVEIAFSTKIDGLLS